jgi:hypothetical protein
LIPKDRDQRADVYGTEALEQAVGRLRRKIADAVERMPDHKTFIARRGAVLKEPAA